MNKKKSEIYISCYKNNKGHFNMRGGHNKQINIMFLFMYIWFNKRIIQIVEQILF